MRVLVTGGAGFIGSNIAERYLKKGHKVTVYDNFSRKLVDRNIMWLKKLKNAKKNLTITMADIRDYKKLSKSLISSDLIFHMAAQVAVTTSVVNPRDDFEVNIMGTFNLLEAARKAKNKPILIYASTNKVYGHLDKIEKTGVSEKQLLDFYSPYGCSKGAADQYVRDYSRIYDIPSIVFRQSCIYGPHQYGVEDQGWLAHFAISALRHKPITIYGDGKQVRDLLYVEDLIDAYELAVKKIKISKGEIYNIGGGLKNALNLIQSIKILENKLGINIKYKFDKQRPGDQKIFISNNSKIENSLGFNVKTSYSDGLEKMLRWLQEEKV